MRNYFKKILYIIVITLFSSAYADSYTDFFRALNIDNARTVEALLAQGFDPNSLSENGQPPLVLALQDGSPKVFALLLASPRIEVDRTNASGETALMMAALRGNLDAAQRLVERGAKVRRTGWTPAHYAASGPNDRVLAFLIERGADINAVAPNGSTPLMMAARYGTEDSVRLLLKLGADKRVLNSLNQSAADMAALSGREWLVPVLR